MRISLFNKRPDNEAMRRERAAAEQNEAVDKSNHPRSEAKVGSKSSYSEWRREAHDRIPGKYAFDIDFVECIGRNPVAFIETTTFKPEHKDKIDAYCNVILGKRMYQHHREREITEKLGIGFYYVLHNEGMTEFYVCDMHKGTRGWVNEHQYVRFLTELGWA